MNIKDKLKSKMEEYLQTRFEWEEIYPNHFRIITPFLDRRNDNIEIYLKYYNDDNIILSDESHTILDLASENIDIDFPVINKIFKGILFQHTVKREDNTLYKKSTLDKLGQRSTNFVQCILKLNDLYLISKWKDILNSTVMRFDNKKDNTSLFINKSIEIDNYNITINTRVIVLNTKKTNFRNSLKQTINGTEDELTKSLLKSILDSNDRESIKYIDFKKKDKIIKY